MSLQPKSGVILLAVLTAGVVMLWGYLLVHQPPMDAGTGAASRSVVPHSSKPSALFLGDSVLAVTAPAGAQTSFAMTASRLLGWDASVDAEPGTGYATPRSPRGKTWPFATRVAALAQRPDIVILAGGTDHARAGVSAT